MKHEYVKIFNEYDKQTSYNHKIHHKYARVDIRALLVKRNKAGEITGGVFYFKAPESKTFTSYTIPFNKEVCFKEILNEITHSNDFVKMQYEERKWLYFHKDALDIEVMFDVDYYNTIHGPALHGILKISSLWFQFESKYIENIFKYFTNFKLSYRLLSGKITELNRQIDVAEIQKNYFEKMLKETNKKLNDLNNVKNEFLDIMDNLNDILEPDRYAEQKLLYELTRGDFK